MIMYHHTDLKTTVLLNCSGPNRTCENIGTTSDGSLVFLNKPKNLHRLIQNLCPITNIAITMVPDSIFARQWVNYVGCHGYMLYPEWHCYDKYDVLTVREMSFNTYISKYWKEREETGCTLKQDCDCATLTHMHHFCRRHGNVNCKELTACLCDCDNCMDNDADTHVCLEPKEYLCFKDPSVHPL